MKRMERKYNRRLGLTRCSYLFLISLICLTRGETPFAQPLLLQMQCEELPADNILIDREDRGLLIIESAVPKLKFIGSNRPIPAEPGVKETMPGVWRVYLSVGTTLLTIQADGYVPIQDIRINLQPRQAKKLRVSGEQPKGTGGLSIETDPPGASVSFNNIPIPGKTPLTLSDQPAGPHSVRIEKEGFRTVEETAIVEKDKTVARRFILQRIYAGLKVASDPSGAQVYLDGDLLGTTPLERSDLKPGEATLVVSNGGFEANTQQIRLVADQTKAINVDLFPQTGSVSITVEPSGAEVWLDEQSLGKYQGTPLVRDKLELGRHSARASLDGYEDASATFNVEYNKTASVNLVLSPNPGALFVVTTPPGADIYLDDRSIGQKSPFKVENVAAGQHKLTLSMTGYGGVVKTITVHPGKTETVTELMTATPRIESGAAAGEQQRIRGPLTGMEFVLIPGGSFMMGSPSNEVGREDDESPQHRVTLKPFYIMTTEVTQKMWKEVMSGNPSSFTGDNLPVEMISWDDCQNFLRKLNQCDPGKGYRLPTEAEWEYACRAETTTRFCVGGSDSDLKRAGWYTGNSVSMTHPVSQKDPNTWGCNDMHGNVWEWCEDWYHDSYSGAPTDGSAWTAGGGTSRVLRGGSWDDNARCCRSTNRFRGNPDISDINYGFRVVYGR